jgi:hypothetical protein
MGVRPEEGLRVARGVGLTWTAGDGAAASAPKVVEALSVPPCC